MPQIFIPPLGTVIKLEEDWHFNLFNESRNERMQEIAQLFPPFRDPGSYVYQATKAWRDMTGQERKDIIDKSDWNYEPHPDLGHRECDYWSGNWSVPFVFREETELKINRIYIRQGQGDFDSVTFSTDCWMSKIGDPLFTRKHVNGRKVKTLRFWAKLEDVNRMVGKIVER